MVTRSSLDREVRSSNLGPVQSDTVLPTASHRCDISSKGAGLSGRNEEGWAPPTRYTLRRITASIIKDLICILNRGGVLEDTFWNPLLYPWPQVLKKTVLFFEPLKLCWKTPETSRKIFEDLFCVLFLEIAWKKFLKNLFLEIALKIYIYIWKHLRLCPWPRAFPVA